MSACFSSRAVRIAAFGGLALSGCLTVGPTGFVRQGAHAFYRGWFDVNTLHAPAFYFEQARRVPYAQERVTCYPPIDRRTPGPRLLLATHQPTLGTPTAGPIVVPPNTPMGAPHESDTATPAPVLSEPELLPPPPAP